MTGSREVVPGHCWALAKAERDGIHGLVKPDLGVRKCRFVGTSGAIELASWTHAVSTGLLTTLRRLGAGGRGNV